MVSSCPCQLIYSVGYNNKHICCFYAVFTPWLLWYTINRDQKGSLGYHNALWQSGDMGEKCNKKVVNFGNWFLCQFSPKTYKFLHGASLTPQKSGDEKKFKKYGQARGEKSKKCEKCEGGVFHRQDWSQFNPLAKRNSFCKTNICEKHPLIAKKWVFILKNC